MTKHTKRRRKRRSRGGRKHNSRGAGKAKQAAVNAKSTPIIIPEF